MTKTLTYNELRNIKDLLPVGSIKLIALKLNLSEETVRNYFGGHNYKNGQSCGLHMEEGPEGGFVLLNDTRILDMALDIIQTHKKA